MKKSWSSITVKFPIERDCLASYVAWQAAEVLMGVKPANLVNVTNRTLPCGRNLATLWDDHNAEVLSLITIEAYQLHKTKSSKLVLFYEPEKLKNTLNHAIVRETLNSLGYVYCTPEEALSHLSTRISDESFPHEIGFFLGYPVKDVLGFMGILNIPLTFNGPWKVYGEKQASLQVVNSHRSAKASVVCSLDSGVSPLTLLKESSTLAA